MIYIPKIGIEQVEYSYYKRVLAYQCRVEEMDDSELTKKIYNYVMNSDEIFGYRRMITSIHKTLNGEDLDTWYVSKINHQKRINHKSCWLLPEKQFPGLDNELVITNNSEKAQTYAEFITVNAGLGNRAPIKGYRQHKECQICLTRNIKVKLNEPHVLFDCEQLKEVQKSYNTYDFKVQNIALNSEEMYKKYWQDFSDMNELMTRIQSADKIRTIYLQVVKRIHKRA